MKHRRAVAVVSQITALAVYLMHPFSLVPYEYQQYYYA